MLILGLSILTQYHIRVLHVNSQEHQILPEMKKEKNDFFVNNTIWF